MEENMLDNGGNTRDTAKVIGNLAQIQIFQDWVGSSDRYDYYQFGLLENSIVNFNLSELEDGANIQIYQEGNNRAIRSQQFSGNDEDKPLNFNLKAGTYYAQISPLYDYFGGSSNTSYKLEASATEIPDRVGDTRDTAKELGSLNQSQTFTDWVGDIDTQDYYKFELTENSIVNFNLSELEDGANIQIYQEGNNRAIRSQQFSGNDEDKPLNFNLKAGTYYAQISPFYDDFGGSSNTSYILEASATEIPDRVGNTRDTAKVVGNLTGEITFQDWVGDIDTQDYYKFELTENSIVNFNLSELEDGANIHIYQEGNNRAIRSQQFSGNDEDKPLNFNLKAGTYYAQISRFYDDFGGSSNTSYKLEMSGIEIVDRAGNTREDAREVGFLKGNQSFSDWVGNIDTQDYYKFELEENSKLNFNLSGLLEGANINIYQEGNNRSLFSRTFSGNESDKPLDFNLNAGIYYARVSNNYFDYFGGSTNTPYNLEINAIEIADKAGNSFNTARDLNILVGNRSFNDFLSDIDTFDYYRFELNKDSSFNLEIEGLDRNAGVILYDNQGQVIKSVTATSQDGTSFNEELEAGDYFVRVANFRGDNFYTLNLGATPNEEELPLKIVDITPETGSNIGETTISLQGSSFSSESQVSLVRNGTSTNADEIVWQNERNLQATFDLAGLPSGEYQVKVTDEGETATAQESFEVNETP